MVAVIAEVGAVGVVRRVRRRARLALRIAYDMCGERAMYAIFADNIEPSFLTKNERKEERN